MDKRKILADHYPFWEQLTSQEEEFLLASAGQKNFAKGEHFEMTQTDCRGIGLLLSGEMRVRLSSEEGREVTLFRLQAADECVLSMSCLMDAIDFHLSVDVVDDAEMLQISGLALKKIMESNPYVALYIYKTATEKFADIMDVVKNVLFTGIEDRLREFLLTASEDQAILYMTHDDIARELGTAREVVSRLLKQLAQDGLVQTKRGQIHILNRDGLLSDR